MTKVVHDTDIGSGLEISGGKLNAAGSMATDAEVAEAIAVADALEDAQLLAEIQASEARDATEEQAILTNVRLQDGLFHNTAWELQGTSVKAHTVDGSAQRFLSISSLGTTSLVMFYSPAPGAVIKPMTAGASPITVGANGFVDLPVWGVLWYKHTGGAQGWYWSTYNFGAVNIPSSDYIRVIALNHDIIGGVTAQLSDGRTIVQGKNYPDTSWINLAPYFTAGVSAYANGFQIPRFRRLNNRVYLEGLLNTPSATYTGALATLPAGFQPSSAHLFTCVTPNSSCRMDVYSDGVLLCLQATGGWVSLDGINFGLE